MGFLKEFRDFAVKGNVMDLAVGVIIGGAFGKIIDSVVNDLIMPLIAAVLGKPDFSGLYVVLADIPAGTENSLAALRKAGVPVFAYGSFFTALLNFLLLAFVVFLMVRQMNRLRREAEAAPAPAAAIPEDIVLLREIRDNLKR
jgi:large conductance mechanosensitive channel